MQLFNMLFDLFLYFIFKSLLCSLNTACHGSWPDLVPSISCFHLQSFFWLCCLEHVPQLTKDWMMGYYFPYPTHMDLPIRKCTGSICAGCQSSFAFVNQECNLVNRFPLVCLFTFLQLNIFHKLKG